MLRVTAAITIPDGELEERFVRASGPGGQNVNKVSTAVELRFDVGASSLPADLKARLASIAGGRMTSEGVLVIDSREHRTQARNRSEARIRLAEMIRRAAVRPKARRKSKPTRAAREKRLAAKTIRSKVKVGRARITGED